MHPDKTLVQLVRYGLVKGALKILFYLIHIIRGTNNKKQARAQIRPVSPPTAVICFEDYSGMTPVTVDLQNYGGGGRGQAQNSKT